MIESTANLTRRSGMTKEESALRDHFAGLAMAAQITAEGTLNQPKVERIVRWAYTCADAMLEGSGSKLPPEKKYKLKAEVLRRD